MLDSSRLCPAALALYVLLGASCSGSSSPSSVDSEFVEIGQGDPDPFGPDTDGDGLSDLLEQRGWWIRIDYEGYGTDSLRSLGVRSDYLVPDSDGDGVDDRTEFLLRLHPSNPDTDLDGLSDRAEIEVWQTLPASVDSDGDARGPDGTAAPNPRLFDGNETRLLCDGQDDDPSLCRHLGTSPTLADTDGDGRTDFEELDDPGRSPLIAELPRAEVEMVGEVDMRLNVEYAESLGSSTEYGTSVAQSTSSSRTQSWSDTYTYSVELTLKGGSDLFGASTGLDPELKLGFAYERNNTLEVSSSRELTEEHSKYQTDSREFTETASTGTIAVGVKISNPTDVTFEVQNFGITVLQADQQELFREPDVALASGAVFKTLATLESSFDSFVLAPGESTEPILLSSNEINTDVLKEFMVRPESLVLRPVGFNVLDAEGRDIDFLIETTQSQTATVELDFGDGRSDVFLVGTNARRSQGGGYRGLRFEEALEGILGRDLTVIDGQLVALDGLVSQTAPDGEPSLPFWGVVFQSPRIEDDQELESLDDITLQAGDVLRMMYFRDEDMDGLADNLEDGQSVGEGDTDGDGLTDLQEFVGWDIETGELDERGMEIVRRVTSHPLLADSDGDGLMDCEESPYYRPEDGTCDADSLFGDDDFVPSNPTLSDPTSVDTDGDGLFDGEDDFILIPASILYVDKGATDGAGDGSSWADAFTSLDMAISELNSRNASSAPEDQVSEVWVAHADEAYTINRTVTDTGASRGRIYGGFLGGETRRGQRIADPVFGGTFVTGTTLNLYAEDIILDGFVFEQMSEPVRLGHADGHGTIRNCLFIDYGGDSEINSSASLLVFGPGQDASYEALVEGCHFVGNEALAPSWSEDESRFLPTGGAITMTNVHPLVVRGCTFEGNRSGKFGGAIGVGAAVSAPNTPPSKDDFEAASGHLILQSSVFDSNQADFSGGAVWAGFGSRVDVSHCEFRYNRAWFSGGAVSLWEADANVIDSLFVANGADAELYGQTMLNGPGTWTHEALERSPVSVYYNEMNNGGTDLRRFGGAIVNRAGVLNVVNTSIVNNFARHIAGDIFDDEGLGTDRSWGGGVAHLLQGQASSPTATGATHVANSIFWGNFGTRQENEDGNLNAVNSRHINTTKQQILEGYSNNPDASNLPDRSDYSSPHVSIERCLTQRLAGPIIPYGSATGILRNDPGFALFSTAVPEDMADANGIVVNQPHVQFLDLAVDARLKADSPALDRGSSFVDIDLFEVGFQSPLVKSVDWYLGPVDLDGNPRFVGVPNTIDLGPYEVQ